MRQKKNTRRASLILRDGFIVHFELRCKNDEDFEASEITDMYDRMHGIIESL